MAAVPAPLACEPASGGSIGGFDPNQLQSTEEIEGRASASTARVAQASSSSSSKVSACPLAISPDAFAVWIVPATPMTLLLPFIAAGGALFGNRAKGVVGS